MRRRGTLHRIVLAVCSVGLLVSGGLFAEQWAEYRAGEAAYETLAETALLSPEAPSEEETSVDRPERGEEPLPQVDFDALSAVNPDIVGWLYLPDTSVSYPVVQGEDNVHYLTHLFDGTPNGAGCLFLDSGCTGLEGRNSVIYGHHMSNGTLFGDLDQYRDQDYWEEHPIIYLITPEETMTVQIFSAYVTGEEWDAWKLTFSQGEYETWLEELGERSCIESGITPRPAEQVLTLSTCDYTFPGARFVCHGVIRGD